MKIMFIDDERNVRLGLKRILRWEDYGFTVVGDAGNSREGLAQLLALRPDVVLLDIRMPGASGLDLIHQSRCQGFCGEFILLTAHADFAYAHEAIRCRVVDYLLKPVDEQELLRAVLNAERRLLSGSAMRLCGGQSVHRLRAALLESALRGRPEGGALFSPLPEPHTGEPHSGEPLRLLLVCCPRGRLDALEQAARQELGAHGVVCSMDGRVAVLLRGREGVAQLEPFIAALMRLDEDALFFCGGVLRAPDALPGEYQRLLALCERRWFVARKGTRRYALDALPVGAAWSQARAAQEMDRALSTRSPDRVCAFFDWVRDSLTCSGLSVADAKSSLLSLHRALCPHDLLEPVAAGLPERIAMADSLDSALELLRCQALEPLSRARRAAGQEVCQALMQYVEQHYAQPLQLQSLARRFGYDSAYLGKLLKGQTGSSFNAYLDRVRLRHACDLLRQGHPVAFVAQQCGLGSAEYFSQKFRKAFGCSPTQYRRQSARH